MSQHNFAYKQGTASALNPYNVHKTPEKSGTSKKMNFNKSSPGYKNADGSMQTYMQLRPTAKSKLDMSDRQGR